MKTILSMILKAALGWFAGWIGGYLQRKKLASETARADTAEQTVAVQAHEIHATEVRNDVDEQVAKLKPVDGITRIDADPVGTAGAELRNDGFTD